jgi:hypothetical protein
MRIGTSTNPYFLNLYIPTKFFFFFFFFFFFKILGWAHHTLDPPLGLEQLGIVKGRAASERQTVAGEREKRERERTTSEREETKREGR